MRWEAKVMMESYIHSFSEQTSELDQTSIQNSWSGVTSHDALWHKKKKEDYGNSQVIQHEKRSYFYGGNFWFWCIQIFPNDGWWIIWIVDDVLWLLRETILHQDDYCYYYYFSHKWITRESNCVVSSSPHDVCCHTSSTIQFSQKSSFLKRTIILIIIIMVITICGAKRTAGPAAVNVSCRHEND